MTDTAPTGHDLNPDQIAYWNGPGGQHWTDRQQTQDVLLAPVSDILIHRAKAKAGERPAGRAGWLAGRVRARRCTRASIRARKLRSPGLAVRRDVFCRAGAF